MAVARLRCDGDSFGSISYHLYYHIRSGEIQLCFVVTATKPAQAISYIFSPKFQLGPNWQQSTTKMDVARLMPIWPKLEFWAENGVYGLCRLGWCYNRAKLYFFWPYMLVSMIWNTSEISASHISRATAIFVVDCCQFGPSWNFGLKMELMACADLVGGVQQSKVVFLLTLQDSINDMKHFWTFCITTKPWHSHFCCWWLPIWP